MTPKELETEACTTLPGLLGNINLANIFLLGCPGTVILLISTSGVAQLIGMSQLAMLKIFETLLVI
jgi:hypothetical protein